MTCLAGAALRQAERPGGAVRVLVQPVRQQVRPVPAGRRGGLLPHLGVRPAPGGAGRPGLGHPGRLPRRAGLRARRLGAKGGWMQKPDVATL